jgi:hypothetical protein
MARLNFDPRNVEPNQVFEPIPTSWYTGEIIESELKPTSNQNGHYLELKVKVLGGDYNNRTVFDRLNLDNPNQQTVDIAYRTLSAICHAVGMGNAEVEDSQLLHGRPLLFKVNERPARTDATTGTRYEASNEIKGYKAIDPTAPPVLGPSKAQQRPFGGAPNGPAGVGAGFPGAGVQRPQQAAPQNAPQGWGANGATFQPAQQPNQPQGYQAPNQVNQSPQFPPQQNGGVQGQPMQQPAFQGNVAAPNGGQVYQQPQQPVVQQPVQQQPQATVQQPVGNVGNPALAQGTPPPWAQAQPAAQVNGASAGSPPPWQK